MKRPEGPLERVAEIIGHPIEASSLEEVLYQPVGLPPPEEHQGSLYDTDTEVVDGWQVFGRRHTSGARTTFEQGKDRCEVRAYIQDGGVMVEIPGGRVRMMLLSDAVLEAIRARYTSR